MRLIGTLADESAADTFASHLFTLGIETRTQPEPGGWGVWACDEDRLPDARRELEVFLAEPDAPRYRAAQGEAGRLRREEERREQAYERRGERLRQAIGGYSRTGFVTIALIAAAVTATLLSGFGAATNDVTQWLSISSYLIEGNRISWPHLSQIREGQVWRLVTPMLLHFGILHLVFNLTWVYTLGGAIEVRRGWWRLLLLVLAAACLSNYAEYALGRSAIEGGEFVFEGTPNFGGLSGVVYALFGYTWMAARFRPALGLDMQRNTVVLMVGWFFLCMTGLMGPVANVAHGVGLLVGLAVGYAPALWSNRGHST